MCDGAGETQWHPGRLARPVDFKLGIEIGLAELHIIEAELGNGALEQIERIDLGRLMTEPAIGADQRVDAGLVKTARGQFNREGRALDRTLGGFTAAPGRLLTTQLESGKKRMPLGINAGGRALPLLIKRLQLRAIFCGSGIGSRNAVIIQSQVDPVGHDGHRTFYIRRIVRL